MISSLSFDGSVVQFPLIQVVQKNLLQVTEDELLLESDLEPSVEHFPSVHVVHLPSIQVVVDDCFEPLPLLELELVHFPLLQVVHTPSEHKVEDVLPDDDEDELVLVLELVVQSPFAQLVHTPLTQFVLALAFTADNKDFSSTTCRLSIITESSANKRMVTDSVVFMMRAFKKLHLWDDKQLIMKLLAVC